MAKLEKKICVHTFYPKRGKNKFKVQKIANTKGHRGLQLPSKTTISRNFTMSHYDIELISRL